MYKKRKSGLTKIMACERRARNIFFSVVASLHSFEYLSRSITSFKPRLQVDQSASSEASQLREQCRGRPEPRGIFFKKTNVKYVATKVFWISTGFEKIPVVPVVKVAYW